VGEIEYRRAGNTQTKAMRWAVAAPTLSNKDIVINVNRIIIVTHKITGYGDVR
jgi:hypothetical protein